jgi:hypothetical protein
MSQDEEGPGAAVTVVYDGDCGLCRRAAGLFVRPLFVGRDTDARPFEAYDGEVAERLRAAGIHDEMAVIDEHTGEIRGGYRGILFAARRGRLGWLARLLALPGVRHGATALYRLVAYNRRILAPPPERTVACACEPSDHLGYRLAFMALSLVATFGCGALFMGALPAPPAGFDPAHAFTAGFARWWALWPWWLGLGSLLTASFVGWRKDGRLFLPTAHVLLTQALGLLPLALGGLLARLLPPGLRWIVLVIALTAALVATGRAARRRLAPLGHGPIAAVLTLWGPFVLGPPVARRLRG